MKFRYKRASKSILSLVLILCLLISCLTVWYIPTSAASADGDDTVGATTYTFYFAPDSDYYTQGSKIFKVNLQNTNGTQQTWKTSGAMTNTGRTYKGMPVYTVQMNLDYSQIYDLQFQGYDGNTQKKSLSWYAGGAGAKNLSEYAGKVCYYSNGCQTATLTYDSFSLYAGENSTATSNTKLADFTYSSGAVYSCTATLTAGQTYSTFVYNSAAGFKSKTYRHEAVTHTTSGETHMYKYDDNITANVMKVQASVTGTYTFTWTLAQGTTAGTEVDGSYVHYGTLRVDFPTIYTVTYSLGQHVNKSSVTGGVDNGTDTISAAVGSNVVLNVTYDTDYEYDGSASALDNAAVSNSGGTFTFSALSANKTISIAAKQSQFNVSLAASPAAGGSVSGTNLTGLTSGQGGTITATPSNSYAFEGWSASPAGKVTFADSGSPTTTFTATGAATITATFVQDTLYPVTLTNGAPAASSETVNVGTHITHTVTADTPTDDEYVFDRWDITGGVNITSGTTTSQTITFGASAAGTVTAIYTHTEYVYFYAGLQDNWSSKAKVKYGTSESSATAVSEYGTYHNNGTTPGSGTGSIPIYDENGNAFGSNATTYYFTGIFRVPKSSVTDSTHIYVGDGSYYEDCGVLNTAYNGYGYFTYSSSGTNYHKALAPQRVTAVSLVPATLDYDEDYTIRIDKTPFNYQDVTTAGHDTFTYTYTLVDQTTDAETVLWADLPSDTGSKSFVPGDSGIAPGTYKAVISTKDAASGRIANACESAAFTISAIPSSSTVSFEQTLSGATNSFTGRYVYKGSSSTAFSNGDSLRAGSQVTLTLVLNSGYTSGSFSTTGITANLVTQSISSNTVTLSFTVPTGGSPVTLTYSALEVKHDVDLVKRFYKDDETYISTAASKYKTISAGLATAASTGDAPATTDYTFWKWALPDSGVTSNDTLTSTSISINAIADNKTVYAEYKETMHEVTVRVNDTAYGAVSRGDSNISDGTTTSIGNITNVTLTANNETGYEFDFWEITPGSNTTVTITKTDNTGETAISSATGSTPPASGDIRKQSSLQFRTNGTATVKAHFKPTQYSISAKFTHNTTSNWNNNSISVTNQGGTESKSGGVINDIFEVHVTLAAGYQIKTVSFTQDAGYAAPTLVTYPSGSSPVIYQYRLNAGNVQVNIELEAIEPSLTNVQIKDRTAEGFGYKYFAADDHSSSGSNVLHYYKQPVEATATTDSFSKLDFVVTGGGSSNAQPSGTEVSLNPNPVMPDAEGVAGEKTYTFTITARNAPEGVDPKTKSYTYTVHVQFNAAQDIHFRLSNLFNDCIDEDPDSSASTDNYKPDAPISAYHTAYGKTQTYLNNGYPAYDVTDTTGAQSKYNEFFTAYENLMTLAKTTTVYALTRYQVSGDAPVNFSAETNGNANDMARFKMYALYTEKLSANHVGTYLSDANHAMTFAGTFLKDSTNRYLYTYTYAGHVDFTVWVGTGSGDATMDDGEKLTGRITGIANFGSYYVNVYDTTKGSSSVNTATPYIDFGYTYDRSKKHMVELDAAKTAADIKTEMGVQPVGSIVSDPGIDGIDNAVTFTLTGPIGKASRKTYDMINGTNLVNGKFPADVAGKYTVNYGVYFGKDANGDTLSVPNATMTLWVASEEVTIYVDMNANVGNPILNFKYWTKAETPVEQGTSEAVEAYLPYEMDLVTGSESIYKYTISIKKLRDEYLIPFSSDTSINISYITVEGVKIGEGTGFDIHPDARITGEVWFKADSTNMTTFQNISYGSVTNSFMAVVEDQNSTKTVLTSAFDRVYGTGIVTDIENQLYKSQYAARYEEINEGEPELVYDFGYTHSTLAKPEITVSDPANGTSTTYYFDKWGKFATPANGLLYDEEQSTLDLTDVTTSEESEKTDLHFLTALDYNDGNGDTTYLALYKAVSSSDSTVRVELTYNFEDYDTSDGNYVFIPGKTTVPASYTKTVKITVGASGRYADYEAVKDAAAEIARTSMPKVKSNYFDYSFDTETAVTTDDSAQNESKLTVSASLIHTPHIYTIILTDGSSILDTKEGNYQQTVKLEASPEKDWINSDGMLLAANKSEYTARFVSEADDNSGTDCQVITVSAHAPEAVVSGTSVITDSYTEVYYQNDTEMLRHNFYIVDYCDEGDLKGGGVLFATMENGVYRKDGVADHLDSVENRAEFIDSILKRNDVYDVSTEYKAQTINNIGFRYKPFNPKEDVFRYSDAIKAYQTVYEGSNINSPGYAGQTLRVFSFMIYDNNGTIVVSPSEGYADVSRYIPQG